LSFSVTQILNGISAATFNSNFEMNSIAVAKTVASSVQGVETENVAVQHAVDTSRRLLRASLTVSASCQIAYSITIPSTASAGYINAAQAYSSVVSSLNSSIASGAFDATLHSTAASVGATNLETAQAGSASYSAYEAITLSTSSSGSNSALSGGAVAGIVIAVLVATGFLIVASWYFIGSTLRVFFIQASVPSNSVPVVQQNPAAAAETSSDIESTRRYREKQHVQTEKQARAKKQDKRKRH
jgi:hypothetical protein